MRTTWLTLLVTDSHAVATGLAPNPRGSPRQLSWPFPGRCFLRSAVGKVGSLDVIWAVC